MKLKKSYILLAATAAMLGACNENAWNDHLDGFEAPVAASGVTNATYTLTSADYATIASLDANKAIAEADGESEALAAIGTNGTFASEEQALKYIPALLETTDKNLPFYTYNNESNVKVTYNVATSLPAEVLSINKGVGRYTISEEDYQQVWGSEEDYINAFAPSKPASASLPGILAREFDSSDNGEMVVVTYNQATENPVFGGGSTPEPDKPVWNETSVVGSLKSGDNATVHGIVTAIDARGFIVTDKSGSVLCYQATGYDQTSVPLYSEVIVEGAVSVFNKGIQITLTGDNYTVCGEGEYTYPAPTKVSGADMDAAIGATDDFLAKYVEVEGTLSISGNYYNLTVEGATASQGSFYMTPDYIKAMVEDGKTYTVRGYFMAISGGKYYQIVVTDVVEKGATAAPRRVKRAPASSIVTTPVNAIYRLDGSWKEATGVTVLQPADYTAMGSTYGNLSGTQPEQYLPVFLKNKYPYAAEGDTKIVAYLYYANQVTAYVAKQFILKDGVWTVDAGQATSQFSMNNGTWKYNPSVVVDLPYARNTEPSYSYYMACVNWVYENICVPMGDTSLTSGKYFIDYRGNAEFYSGASAFYGNVDIRATSALNHVPDGYTGYDGLTNEEITLLMKKRFSTEVLPPVLEQLHSDMRPADDMEVTLTVNFTAYDNAAIPSTIVYKVVGPGKFEYKSSTWVKSGEDADWK